MGNSRNKNHVFKGTPKGNAPRGTKYTMNISMWYRKPQEFLPHEGCRLRAKTNSCDKLGGTCGKEEAMSYFKARYTGSRKRKMKVQAATAARRQLQLQLQPASRRGIMTHTHKTVTHKLARQKNCASHACQKKYVDKENIPDGTADGTGLTSFRDWGAQGSAILQPIEPNVSHNSQVESAIQVHVQS